VPTRIGSASGQHEVDAGLLERLHVGAAGQPAPLERDARQRLCQLLRQPELVAQLDRRHQRGIAAVCRNQQQVQPTR
jgi:hypothetical protein